MVYIRTRAYNAEKTIARTVESVLNQSYKDIKYYVLENGSTDRTREILDEYAKKDSRMTVFYNEVNGCTEGNEPYYNMVYDMDDDDYVAFVDADDYYETNFVEEMLAFMKENDLDVAACGTLFENEMGQSCGGVVQKTNFILKTPEEYNENFTYAHWNMRQAWGKLYKGNVAKNRYEKDLPDWYPRAYGGDTANLMYTLRFSKGFGVYAKALHHYQISSKSVSYKWIEGREDSDVLLNMIAHKFLEEKAGIISPYNKRFLVIVYLNALRDTFKVLFNSDLSDAKKIQLATKIYSNSSTIEALDLRFEDALLEDQIKILNVKTRILEWMMTIADQMNESELEQVYSFCLTYGQTVQEIFPKDFFDQIIKEDKELIQSFILGQTGTLLQHLTMYYTKKDASGELQLSDVIFAQNIAAFYELNDLYIIYSKKYIELLIRDKQYKLAQAEIQEWEEILPEDGDLMKLKKELGEIDD